MQRCETCGGHRHGDKFYVSSANSGKVAWPADKMHTRVCRYAKGRGKPCLNECNKIIPSETFESRAAMVERAIAIPDHVLELEL